MLRYRFNARFVGSVALSVLLLAACTHLLHAWQMRRHARGQVERADAAERSGDLDAAAASLGRALAFQSGDRTVQTRQARLLAKNATTHRERLKALAALKGVLPARGGDLEVRLEASELALLANAPDEACKLLRPAVEEHPDRADLREKLARAQEAAARFADAAGSLEKVLELEPGRVSAAESLARLYATKLDQPRRAVGVLERLVTRHPGLAGAYRARGQDRMARGQLEKADADLAEARRLDGRDADVLAASAELALRRGQLEQARAFWDRAVAARPDSLPFALGLARACREQGRTAEAAEAVRQGLVRHPDDLELTFLLADLLVDKGDLAEAARLGAKLPEAAKGHRAYLRGRALLARRQPAAAVKALLEAHAEKDLPPGMAALALVRAFGELGQHADQLAAAREAVRLASTPASRVELARVLAVHGQGAEALKDLRQLSELPSPPPGVWAPLARVLIEQNIQRPPWLRKWDEVEKLLAKADEVPADAASAVLLRSDVLILRDRPGEALGALEAGRKKRPDEPILWQAEAALAERQGDPARAQELLEQADRRFNDRLDWQTARAWRLVSEKGAEAPAALEDLERKSTDLTAEDRDRLTRTLAQLHARLGNYPAVERLCAQTLHADPNDVNSHLLLAEARRMRGDLAGAEKALDALRKIEGADGVQWRCGRAELLMQRGRKNSAALTEARRLLEEAQQARPTWPYPPLLLGRLDDLEGKPAQALEHYQRSLSLGDYRPHTVRRAVSLLLSAGRGGEADKVLEQAERVGTLERELWRPAAEIALRANRPDRAAALARRAVGKSRAFRDLLWLGRVLGAAGRHSDAEETLEQAASAAPDSTEVWLTLVAHHVLLGRKADAEYTLARMKQAVREDRLPPALGRGYEIMGRWPDAEKTYRRAVARDPRDAVVLRRLADLYLRNDEAAKAERVLAALLDPRVLVPEEDLPEIRRQLALAVTAPGRGTGRVEQALALVAMNKHTEGETEADRRTAALVKGTVPDQRAEAVEALEALPNGPAVLATERVRLAALYEAEGRWPSARRQYAALLAKDRDNAAVLALLIEGLIRQNKRAEAEQWLEKLEKLEPASPRTLKLGETLRKPAKPEA